MLQNKGEVHKTVTETRCNREQFVKPIHNPLVSYQRQTEEYNPHKDDMNITQIWKED